MARQRSAPETVPALYAMVAPGLEAIAADEITRDLGGDVRKTARGFVLFRLPEITPEVLTLRTVEDVYLYAWGTDSLTHRAADLKNITQWTTRDADWPMLLKYHHAIRPKPKGKPTWWLVTQMSGKHVYRRVDAREAMAKGLDGHLPASWRPEEENAAVEIWLTIQNKTAICGLRLSDRTMRHRTYKMEHMPASLRPSIAGAMVRLLGAGPGHVVVDPMCGAGTLLAEQLELARTRRAGFMQFIGGDLERQAVQAALANLRRLGTVTLARWDARRLPLETNSVDRLVSNLPFGVQLSDPASIGLLYQHSLREADRVLRPGGRVVLLVGEVEPLREAARKVSWRQTREYKVRVLGQSAVLTVWEKPTG